MSPEQAEGRAVDARSDIFSFGAVIYELISGRRAFDGATTSQVITAVLRDEPPALQTSSVFTALATGKVWRTAARWPKLAQTMNLPHTV